MRSLRDLDTWLKANADAGRFSGIVRYDRPGRAPWVRCYGLADREAKRPVTPATRFNIGPLDKMFTAVAAMQLVDAGKLSLDDRVARFFRYYPNREVKDLVTVRQLLTHVSGLGGFRNERYRERKESIRTVTDMLGLFSDEPLAFPPGNRVAYSDSGYVLLGAILEKLVVEEYYDLVRKAVFQKAGMADTDYPELPAQGTLVAKGYTSEGGTVRPNLDTLPNRGGPAGGGVSTAADLARFAEALRNGRLVSQSTLDLMTTPATAGAGSDLGYGLGFGVREDGGRRSFGHGGGAPGVSAELRMFPATGETIVVLSNRDPGSLEGVLQRLLAATAGAAAAKAEEAEKARPR